jgi:hypothetical protein
VPMRRLLAWRLDAAVMRGGGEFALARLRAGGGSNGESGLVQLRAGGASNEGGARCGVCGDARCDGWGCVSKGEKGWGAGAVKAGASRTSSWAGEGV